MKGRFDFHPPKGPIRHIYNAAVFGEDFPEEGIVGPYRTAKSNMLIDSGVRRGLDYPGMNVLIARATLTSLKDSTLKLLESRFPFLTENANRNEANYPFPVMPHPLTGQPVRSRIKGIGLDRADIEQVLSSTAWGTVLLEEGEELPSDVIDIVQSRARQEIFHRSKTVWDLCVKLSRAWGIHAEDVYEILRDDPRHPVSQFDLDKDGPMPGNTVVRVVWNPDPDDHLWQRFVGIPYPRPVPTPEWTSKNVGVREVHVKPQRFRERGDRFVAGAIVLMPDGSKRVAKKHRDDGIVELVVPNGSNLPAEVHENEAGLVVKRNCMYVFPEWNMSQNFTNTLNSYLMVNAELADSRFAGKMPSGTERVASAYQDVDVKDGGNVVKVPARGELAKLGWVMLGGIDGGGAHATALGAAILNPRTKQIVVIDEFAQSGVPAAEAALNAQGMILPGTPRVYWGYDPAIANKRYDRDTEYSMLTEYQEVLGSDNLFPGVRGWDGYELLNKLLMPKENWINGKPMPTLLIASHCTQSRQALTQLTRRMVTHQRDNPMVDIGDMLKYMVSMWERAVSYLRAPVSADSVFQGSKVVKTRRPKSLARRGG